MKCQHVDLDHVGFSVAVVRDEAPIEAESGVVHEEVDVAGFDSFLDDAELVAIAQVSNENLCFDGMFGCNFVQSVTVAGDENDGHPSAPELSNNRQAYAT